MCLITTQKKPHIATEDMVVYKLLIEQTDTTCCSIYETFQWTIGKLYNTIIRETEYRNCADDIDSNWLNSNYPKWHDKKYSISSVVGNS